jgi:hypothetical protein
MQIDEGSMSRDELLLRLQSDNKELRKEKDKLRGDVERFCARYSSALQSKAQFVFKRGAMDWQLL